MTVLNAEQIRQRFIEAFTADFKAKVRDFAKLEALVVENGGTFLNDHAAIRIADPETGELLRQAMTVMGFEQVGLYEFPNIKFVSTAYHIAGNHSGFKLFTSTLDLDNFPADLAAAIREDNRRIAAAVDHTPLKQLIDKATENDGLTAEEADRFVGHIIGKLLSRNKVPVKQSTITAIKNSLDFGVEGDDETTRRKDAGVVAAAVALGAETNHITIDTAPTNFATISDVDNAMRAAGFTMKPEIERAPGGILNQTSAQPALESFMVLEDDGTIGTDQGRLRFVEIIERGRVTAENLHHSAVPIPESALEDGPITYDYFIPGNAKALFNSASMAAAPTSNGHDVNGGRAAPIKKAKG